MNDIFENIKIDEEKPIRETVFETLRKLIYENKLKPGERLVESTIADKLGVSRTPVREALRQLELEGLAVNIPRRGTTVIEISIENAAEMYNVREVLEGLSARLSCNNMPRKQINYLREVLSEMDACMITEDKERLYALNKSWNETIVKYSQNEILNKYMKELHDNLERLRVITMKEKSLQKDIISEYKKIFKAFESGNLDEAENAAREHVRNAKKRYMSDMAIKAN